MAKNTINTRPLKRMPYRPKVYKHKNDAREIYVELQPTGLIVDKNGSYYSPEGYAYTSVNVNIPEITKPSVTMKLCPELPYYIKRLDSLKQIVITANVVKGTYNISLVRFRVNNTVVHDITEEVSSGGPFVYTHIFDTPQDRDFSVSVEIFDKDNRMVSMSQDVKFVFRSFMGS